MKIRQASPEKSWDRNLSPQHDEIYSDIFSSIQNVAQGSTEDPRAIVGPYGSGKTQLLYEAFNISWEEAQIPALYTDAESILRGFEASDSNDITAWLSDRVRDQVAQLNEGKSVSWLPNFASKARRERWLNSTVKETEIAEDEICVLLVDEIEQAYDSLRKQMDTDDENTFRGLLDDVEGVYQIWSFGLVSAYEILGEADLRRFKELRVPVLDTEDVYRQLEQNNKPTGLANGIWWIARGRAGWVNKLVDELPNEESDILDWFDRVSDYEFFDTNPVDQTVIRDHLEGKTESWDNARRSLLFLSSGYDEWEIAQSNFVPVENAADILLNIIIKDSDLTARAARILERNLERVLMNLSTNRWSGGESEPNLSKLPVRIFTQESEIEGILTLARYHITSFEPREDARGNAIELLRDVKPGDIIDNWSLQDPDIREGSVHTTRPSIVVQAYPSIAVDPSILTNKSTEDLKQEIETPIDIDPGIRTEHLDVYIKYCPTKRTFEHALDRVRNSKEIPSTFVVIKPDTSEARDWEPGGFADDLEELSRLSILYRGSARLQGFLLQFQEYLSQIDGATLITEEKKETAVENETVRQRIDTVETLYNQVDRIATTSAREARDSFVSTYSLPEKDQPVWANPDLESTDPFWHYGRTTSISVIGLSYALAVSRGQWDSSREYLDIPDTLTTGYDRDYVNQSEFRLKQFLDLIFTADSFGRQMQRKREEFGTADGTKKSALRRLQKLLFYIIDTAEDLERSQIQEEITNIDTNPDEVRVWAESQFERQQGRALLWGLLLDGFAEENKEAVVSRIDATTSKLQNINNEVSNVQTEIDLLNEELSPPEDLGQSVSIKVRELEDYRSNMESLSESLEMLGEDVRNNTGQTTIGLVFAIISGRYTDLLDTSLEDMIDPVYEYNVLSNVENLKSRFNQIRRQVRDEDHLTTHTTLSQQEIQEQLNIIGDSIFDFKKPLGTSSLDLDDLEAIERLANKAEQDLTEIRALSNAVDELSESQNERIREQEVLIEETDELLSDVVDRPDQIQ